MEKEFKSFKEELALFRENFPLKEMEVKGGKFIYTESGKENEKAIVLLNGGMNTQEMWLRYVEGLSKDYRVITFDYPMEFKDNQSLAEGMHEFFSFLGIKKPILAGASYGGLNAQIFAKKYPEDVGGLVLMSTCGLDKKTIRKLKRQYFVSPLMLFYMRHCNYEKLKPKLMAMGMKHARDESAENQKYAFQMFFETFKTMTKEKDLHITGLLFDLMHQEPVTADDFKMLEGKIMLILPSDDFFSPSMQKDLKALMHSPKIVSIEGDHMSTIFKHEEYEKRIREAAELL